jgi:hypothetical protein
MERGKFICQGLLLRPAPLVFFAESVRYFSVVFGCFSFSSLYFFIGFRQQSGHEKTKQREPLSLTVEGARQGLYVGTGRDEMAA